MKGEIPKNNGKVSLRNCDTTSTVTGERWDGWVQMQGNKGAGGGKMNLFSSESKKGRSSS